MKRILLSLALLFAAPAFATDRVLINPESNGDLKIKANVGGTATDAITITGSTGATTINTTGSATTLIQSGGIPTLKLKSPGAGAFDATMILDSSADSSGAGQYQFFSNGVSKWNMVSGQTYTCGGSANAGDLCLRSAANGTVLSLTPAGVMTFGSTAHRATIGGAGSVYSYAHLNGFATYIDASDQGEAGSATFKCTTCSTTVENLIDWNGQGAAGNMGDDDDLTIYGTCALNNSPNTAAQTTVYRIFAALHVEIAAGTATFTQSASSVTATDTTGSAFTTPTLTLTPVVTTGGSGTLCAPCRATWGITNPNAGSAFGCTLNKFSRRGRAYWIKN
jgi:hypothetical protein